MLVLNSSVICLLGWCLWKMNWDANNAKCPTRWPTNSVWLRLKSTRLPHWMQLIIGCWTLWANSKNGTRWATARPTAQLPTSTIGYLLSSANSKARLVKTTLPFILSCISIGWYHYCMVKLIYYYSVSNWFSCHMYFNFILVTC